MMLNGFLGVLYLWGSLAKADVEIKWFETLAKRTREFCRTSVPPRTSRCDVADALTADVFLPRGLGQIIETHIARAADLQAYGELSLEDFYHGHLILRGSSDHFSSPDAFFADVKAILYHTAEFNNRWEDERSAGVPSRKRRPRSLLGFLDGQLSPAINFAPDPTPGYERSGTIYESDVEPTLPPPIFVQIEGHQMQMYSLQFYILPQADGRFHTPAGESFEVFIRGVENLSEAQMLMLSLPRPD